MTSSKIPILKPLVFEKIYVESGGLVVVNLSGVTPLSHKHGMFSACLMAVGIKFCELIISSCSDSV